MSQRWVRWCVLFGLAGVGLGYISRLTTASHDMFHGMALFREALAAGAVPRTDSFAYTPTVAPVVHHEWGMGAVLYGVTVGGGGAAGLMLLKYLLTAGVAVGCYTLARRRGAGDAAFALAAPLALVLGWVGFGTIRAQLFTLFFLTLLLWLLEEDRRGRRWWIAAWLPLYVVWLNIHGGVVAGVGLFALYAGERFVGHWRSGVGQAFQPDLQGTRSFARSTMHLFATGAAMIGLAWVNPYGTDYIVYLWHGLRMERPLIVEWWPLWHTYQPALTMAVYALSVGLVAYAARARGVAQLPGLALVAVSAWMALAHIRHASIYAVVWLCYAPGYLEGTELGRRLRESWRDRAALLKAAGVVCGIAGLSVAAANRCWELHLPTVAGYGVVYPAGACDYLAERDFTGNLMVPFSAGAFVSWKLSPQVQVSLDGRYEVAYRPGLLPEHFALYDAEPGWESILARYPTDAVLVPRGGPLEAALEDRLRSDPPFPWRPRYRDDGFSLYFDARRTPAVPLADRTGSPIIAAFP